MSNPTNEQELREQIQQCFSSNVEESSDSIELFDTDRVIADIATFINAYTNAEIAKAVKEAKPFPVGGSEFADGYMAGIKQYETNLMKFIERAKLKEVK